MIFALINEEIPYIQIDDPLFKKLDICSLIPWYDKATTITNIDRINGIN